MTDLPTGTVTFLFSDIEGSTRLAAALGERWPEALETHRTLLREAFATGGGVEVGTEGDSFFVAFPTALGAVRGAVAGQRALAGHPWASGAAIRVRMGMHVGEGTVRDDDYVGLDVHRAARIAAAGHGGEVLVSDAVRVLVDGSLPEGLSVRDLGERRLKDLSRPEHLYQLVIAGLPDAFPPLRTADAIVSNLPGQLSTFLGREREMAEIGGLLTRTRLLTLTGPGGTGKTRLSLQVASRFLDHFPDGVFFVPLEAIRDRDLFAATVAGALGIPDRGGSAPMARLTSHLRDRHALLVLDNFEQLVDAGPLVGELLASAPQTVALVTSRSALGISGEREYPVPPLDVPDPRHLPDPAGLSQYEAVALFIDRATAVRPAFTITNANAPAVAEICARLDGLPLAIELAAARIKVLTPEAILARLAQGLGVLSAAAPDRPERQQTLRGAIAWSFDLLDPVEQQLFMRVGAFVGGAELEAIEAVCPGDDAAGVDILEGVTSLVENSLLRQESGLVGMPRYRMLETIREYALERLEESGRAPAVRERHAAYFVRLANDSGRAIMSPDKRRVLDRLEAEHDNLRAAIEWSIATGDARSAMRLLASLWRFWQTRGYLAEGMDRAGRVLAMHGVEDLPEEHAAALEAAGGLAWWSGDLDTMRERYVACLAVRRRLGDPGAIAEALYNLSFADGFAGHGDVGRGMAHAREALALWEAAGDRLGVAKAKWSLGNLSWFGGDFEASRSLFAEALPVFRDVGDRFQEGWALYDLGLLSVRSGELEQARRELYAALRIFMDAGDVSGYTLVLDAVAALALHSGDRQTAARISGAVATLERQTGTGLNPMNRAMVDFDPASLTGDPATADAWSEGSHLSPLEIVDEVLGREGA